MSSTPPAFHHHNHHQGFDSALLASPVQRRWCRPTTSTVDGTRPYLPQSLTAAPVLKLPLAALPHTSANLAAFCAETNFTVSQSVPTGDSGAPFVSRSGPENGSLGRPATAEDIVFENGVPLTSANLSRQEQQSASSDRSNSSFSCNRVRQVSTTHRAAARSFLGHSSGCERRSHEWQFAAAAACGPRRLDLSTRVRDATGSTNPSGSDDMQSADANGGGAGSDADQSKRRSTGPLLASVCGAAYTTSRPPAAYGAAAWIPDVVLSKRPQRRPLPVSSVSSVAMAGNKERVVQLKRPAPHQAHPIASPRKYVNLPGGDMQKGDMPNGAGGFTVPAQGVGRVPGGGGGKAYDKSDPLHQRTVSQPMTTTTTATGFWPARPRPNG